MNDTKWLELGLVEQDVSPTELLKFVDSLNPQSLIYFPANLPPDKKPMRQDIVDLAEENASFSIQDNAEKGWVSGIFHIQNKDGDRLVAFLGAKKGDDPEHEPVVLYRTTTPEEIKAIELRGMSQGPTRNFMLELVTWTYHYKQNTIRGNEALKIINRCFR